MAAAGVSFGPSLALIWESDTALEQSASALAKDQRRERAALWRGRRVEVDHEVSILIRLGEGPARPNVSTMIIRPPQHGHGREGLGGSSSPGQLKAPFGRACAAVASNWRARAMFRAQALPANKP